MLDTLQCSKESEILHPSVIYYCFPAPDVVSIQGLHCLCPLLISAILNHPEKAQAYNLSTERIKEFRMHFVSMVSTFVSSSTKSYIDAPMSNYAALLQSNSDVVEASVQLE